MKVNVVVAAVLFLVLVSAGKEWKKSFNHPVVFNPFVDQQQASENAAESQDQEPRGVIVNNDGGSARAPEAPGIPGGVGGAGGNQMYMGMFQMVAMPMKAPEMPSLPSLPGAGGS